ncbi:MAG: hypothetical protein J6023_03510 [Clostridia bacterium]|nr:hypothetical protein [Clostridia bacterium]
MGKAKKVIFFAILGFCVCIFILGSVLMCRDIRAARSLGRETTSPDPDTQTENDSGTETDTESLASSETSASSGSKHHVVLYEYGNFSGWDVIFEEGPMPSVTTRRVSHYLFRCTSSFTIRAEKDGEVYLLEDAYQNGLLTENDIAEICRLHREFMEEGGFGSLYEGIEDYGFFGDWYVRFWGQSSVGKAEIDIGCYSFRFPSRFVITAEKDGWEYGLEEVFENGFLTEDDIAEIYQIHRAYCERCGYASLYED